MELVEYRGTFIAERGNFITADVRYSAESTTLRPVVLVLHGFTAFRRWGFFPYLGKRLAVAGAISLVMDFWHNGYGKESGTLDNPELFAMNTVGKELEDVATMLTALRQTEFPGWNGRIHILGHSRGGAIENLAANNDGDIDHVAAWSAISTFDRFTQRQKKLWRETGFFPVANGKTDKPLGMNVAYLEDLSNEGRDVLAAAANLKADLLLVHGEQDMTVRAGESQKIAEAATGTIVKIIPQTGHTFGVSHPFAETTPALEAAIETTIDFFALQDSL